MSKKDERCIIKKTKDKEERKMTLNEKQKLLDEQKWIKSEQEGRDVCGEFDYCKFCDKSIANPCATALEKTEKKPAKVAAKKVCSTKTCSKKASATKTKETKKTATKKAPAKKTTKK